MRKYLWGWRGMREFSPDWNLTWLNFLKGLSLIIWIVLVMMAGVPIGRICRRAQEWVHSGLYRWRLRRARLGRHA